MFVELNLWGYLADPSDETNNDTVSTTAYTQTAVTAVASLLSTSSAPISEMPDPSSPVLGASPALADLAYTSLDAPSASLRGLLRDADKLSVRSARLMQVLLEGVELAENEAWLETGEALAQVEVEVRRKETEVRESKRYEGPSQVD